MMRVVLIWGCLGGWGRVVGQWAMLDRRGLLSGLGVFLAAPAIARVSSLMPVHSITPIADWIERTMDNGGIIENGVWRPERGLRFRGRDGMMVNCKIIYDVPPDALVTFEETVGDMRFVSCHFDGGGPNCIGFRYAWKLPDAA